jgi:hypothetical protein
MRSTGLTGVRRRSPESSKRRTRVEAKQVVVSGHPSDGERFKSSKNTLQGLLSLVVIKGYFRLTVASI